jgi:hypothetical protein
MGSETSQPRYTEPGEAWITDSEGVGGVTGVPLEGVTIGVVHNGSTGFELGGILGLGPNGQYPIVPDVMFNRGCIYSRTFSLYLGGVSEYM